MSLQATVFLLTGSSWSWSSSSIVPPERSSTSAPMSTAHKVRISNYLIRFMQYYITQSDTGTCIHGSLICYLPTRLWSRSIHSTPRPESKRYLFFLHTFCPYFFSSFLSCQDSVTMVRNTKKTAHSQRQSDCSRIPPTLTNLQYERKCLHSQIHTENEQHFLEW